MGDFVLRVFSLVFFRHTFPFEKIFEKISLFLSVCVVWLMGCVFLFF